MAMENFDSPPGEPRKPLEAPEQVDFLCRVQLLTEAADAAERRRLAEYERACRPLEGAAPGIPERQHATQRATYVRNVDRRSSCQTVPVADRTDNIREQLACRERVGIDKQQPITAGPRG